MSYFASLSGILGLFFLIFALYHHFTPPYESSDLAYGFGFLFIGFFFLMHEVFLLAIADFVLAILSFLMSIFKNNNI